MSSSAFTPTKTEITTEVPVNVPVVTAWEAYTPTYAAGTINGTTLSGFWRRSGDTLETKIRIQGSASSSLSSSTASLNYLPTGLTVDTTKLAARPGDRGWTSTGTCFGSFSNSVYNPCILEIENPATTARILVLQTANSSPFSATNFTALNTANFAVTALNNVDRFMEFHLSVPISQWAGSGTTTLATRAVEEYAWNSNTTNVSNTSAFGNGLDGVLFPNITATGSTVNKRVRFQSDILPTDSVFIEYQQIGQTQWRQAAARFSLILQGPNAYGLELLNVSSTDVDVRFHTFGATPSGSTYGSAGDLWSNYFTAGWKWRVRRVSGGAQIGYPVSARNIVGDTSGSVVPTGMLGEIISSKTSAATSTTTGVYFDAATITLNGSGTYRLDSTVRYSLNGATITTWQGELFFGTTTGNNAAGFDLNENYWNVPSPTTSSADCSINATQVINYNSTTGVIIFSGGATITLTGGVLRLKSRPGGFTGGPVQYRAFLTATRIA